MNLRKIKRAIISVSNKEGLNFILPILKKFNIEIISSGRTYKKIKKMNYNCIEVSNYTGFSEMLDGRVKTLHPKIHAGILNIRKNSRHRKQIKKRNIPEIDLVIVDLYPFEKYIEKKSKKLIESIDIRGPTLIRAILAPVIFFGIPEWTTSLSRTIPCKIEESAIEPPDFFSTLMSSISTV